MSDGMLVLSIIANVFLLAVACGKHLALREAVILREESDAWADQAAKDLDDANAEAMRMAMRCKAVTDENAQLRRWLLATNWQVVQANLEWKRKGAK